MKEYDFSKVKEYMDWLPEAGIPASQCVIYQEHEKLFEYGSGFSDSKKTKPVAEKDLYYLFSATKTVTCAAGLQLLEQGKIKLTDPVEQYLPEYSILWVEDPERRHAARRGMTIENLFTMTGGLDYDVNKPEILDLRRMPFVSAKDAALAFILNPIKYQPGERFCYSWCHDVLAAVIEVVSGKRFGEYVQEAIFDPLGMTDCSFVLTPEKKSRLSAQYFYDNGLNTSEEIIPSNEFILGPGYESGGAGLIGSVKDMGLFADAMASGGVGANGARILKEETVALATENKLTPIQLRDFRYKPKYYGYGWGLCGRVHMEPRISRGRSPVGAFGWGGAAGAYIMMDPFHKLSIFYATHIRNCEFAHEKVHFAIRDMTYDILGLETEV